MAEFKGKLGEYHAKIKGSSPNSEILELLEKSIDTAHPEQGEIPIKLLGFGEISLVFQILSDQTKEFAFKRLPIFESVGQVSRHIQAYNEYNRLLRQRLHIQIPDSDSTWVYANEKKTKISLYCIQKVVNPESIGNKIIHSIGDDDLRTLITLILKEMAKVWDLNRSTPINELQVGLDGQISNWAVNGYSNDRPSISLKDTLTYLDTSTPMYRVGGEDAMEGKLFLKSAPSFLRWVLKPLLKEVLDRYYSWRDVLIDLTANFYKEQKPEAIPAVIETINHYFATEGAVFGIEPLHEAEVRAYYKHDKFIWVLFQNLRRFDRFLKVKILRQKYDFYLPEKIRR